MADIDFTDRSPSMALYAENTVGNHDKFYEARVDLGDDGRYYLTKRWGRNPSQRRGGQVKQESYPTMTAATGACHKIFNKKLEEGYVDRPWPHGQLRVPDLTDRTAVEEWLNT